MKPNTLNNPAARTAPRPLRAGTETGSLVNYLYSGSASSVPEVGMGATILSWTDRRACTVIEVTHGGRRIVLQEDTATRTDGNGMSDSQSYAYTANPDAPRHAFTLRRNGAWVREGEGIKGQRCAVGLRDHYHDFSF